METRIYAGPAIGGLAAITSKGRINYQRELADLQRETREELCRLYSTDSLERLTIPEMVNDKVKDQQVSFQTYLDLNRAEQGYSRPEEIRIKGQMMFSGKIFDDVDYRRKLPRRLIRTGLSEVSTRTFVGGIPKGLIKTVSLDDDHLIHLNARSLLPTNVPAWMQEGLRFFYDKNLYLLQGGLQVVETGDNYQCVIEHNNELTATITAITSS